MVLALVALLTFIASVIGTLSGFGISTIMVPIVLFFYPLPETLLFVGIIHWFGDIFKIALFRKGIRWDLLFEFGLAGIIATIIGARLIFIVSNLIILRILGALLVAYFFFLLLKPTFKIRKSSFNAVLGGSASGFLAGIFGIGGAVRGAFLSIYDLPKEVYIATSGAIALLIDSARLTAYVTAGSAINPTLFKGLLIFVPISFLGAGVAKRLVEKIPQDKFRLVIAAFLFLVGLKLINFP